MMNAFNQWFKNQYEQSPESAISYLFDCCLKQPDSVVWEYLQKTGDTEFTPETFHKAAQLIIKGE